MRVGNEYYRTLWPKKNRPEVLCVIDQRKLPHFFEIAELHNVEETAEAIRNMTIRGAGLIGAVAAYAMYQASLEVDDEKMIHGHLQKSAIYIKETRPTAVNLEWAVNRQLHGIAELKAIDEIRKSLFEGAMRIADEDAAMCEKIGEHGLSLIEELATRNPQRPVNVLTHCNAGWLAFVDWGTALAPIYKAHAKGISVHVWVDETRPVNQGSRLTAWELQQEKIPHTVIADNAGGHLMQHGMVDLVIVGCDRATRNGDAANKIGTYLKALAAKDNGVPFYVALPHSTIDWNLQDGVKEIPIEKREGSEVSEIGGLLRGKWESVRLTPELSPTANYGFDVTPARLISGLITERGICEATERGLKELFEVDSGRRIQAYFSSHRS